MYTRTQVNTAATQLGLDAEALTEDQVIAIASVMAQTYTAATDGLARKMYLYPDKNLATQYWFGTILPDFSIDSDVGAAMTVSASWAAASPIIKVG